MDLVVDKNFIDRHKKLSLVKIVWQKFGQEILTNGGHSQSRHQIGPDVKESWIPLRI